MWFFLPERQIRRMIGGLFRRLSALISVQFWATVGAVLLGNALAFVWLYALISIIRNERTSGPLSEQPFHVVALAAVVPLVMSAALYFCVTI